MLNKNRLLFAYFIACLQYPGPTEPFVPFGYSRDALQEGSGYNKAMELYNPSGIEVSLDGWTWGIHFNGGSSHDKHNNTFGEGTFRNLKCQ